MPVGASAVSRSEPVGKSATRRTGPGPTVAGSKTTTSAQAPATSRPRSASPKMSAWREVSRCDGGLEAGEGAVAYPVAEVVGGLRGIAELADVGTRVRQPERAAGFGEHGVELVDVVVGQDAADPQAEVGLVERGVQQQIERLARRAPRRRRRSRRPTSSGCAADSAKT